MKNWIIVALIFVLPICVYGFLDAQAQNEAICKVVGNSEIKNPSIKIIKFYSPMCSECQDATKELQKAMETNKETVIVEEINVLEKKGKIGSYGQSAIKKYDISLVPTLVFVNKEGKTIKKHQGVLKADEITKIVKENKQ